MLASILLSVSGCYGCILSWHVQCLGLCVTQQPTKAVCQSLKMLSSPWLLPIQHYHSAINQEETKGYKPLWSHLVGCRR